MSRVGSECFLTIERGSPLTQSKLEQARRRALRSTCRRDLWRADFCTFVLSPLFLILHQKEAHAESAELGDYLVWSSLTWYIAHIHDTTPKGKIASTDVNQAYPAYPSACAAWSGCSYSAESGLFSLRSRHVHNIL